VLAFVLPPTTSYKCSRFSRSKKWNKASKLPLFLHVHLILSLFSRQRIVVTGSSVAAGYHATRERGWATLLREELGKRRSSTSFENVAIPGANTQDIIRSFKFDVATLQPGKCFALRLNQQIGLDIVIVGLSLMNEGLVWMNPEDAYDSFKKGTTSCVSRSSVYSCRSQACRNWLL